MTPGDYYVTYTFVCRNYEQCRMAIDVRTYTITGATIRIRGKGWIRFDPEGWTCPKCAAVKEPIQ